MTKTVMKCIWLIPQKVIAFYRTLFRKGTVRSHLGTKHEKARLQLSLGDHASAACYTV